VEGSQSSEGPEVLVRGGPEKNIEREASVSFPSQGEDWLDRPCHHWGRGVCSRGAEVRPDVRKVP
jgi:hypothetical protein